jgi:hypothetical protein
MFRRLEIWPRPELVRLTRASSSRAIVVAGQFLELFFRVRRPGELRQIRARLRYRCVLGRLSPATTSTQLTSSVLALRNGVPTAFQADVVAVGHT